MVIPKSELFIETRLFRFGVTVDITDLVICKALMTDARISYKDLGKLTGLSAVAVHNRVHDLMGSGIIGGFQAEIDIRALKGSSLMIFGRTEINSPTELCKALGANDSTSMVLIGSGNYVYIGAMVRSISGLEEYLSFVRSVGRMPQAVAGIHTIRPSGAKMTDIPDVGNITPLEMRILAALRNDARKRTTDISSELGVSARTISNKLDGMIRDHKVNLTIRWRPDYSNNTVALCHMALKNGADKGKAMAMLYGKYSPNVVFLSSFGNMPELIIATVWTQSSKGISKIADDLMAEGCFETVTPNIICAGYFFDTWKEKLLERPITVPKRID
jgi:Lrp/AsnC family leucine-responsive transcriptional regulator